MSSGVTRTLVLERSTALSGMARVVADVLATIDDPDGCLRVLAHSVQHDPVIVGRVLAAANRAAVRSGRGGEVVDVFSAIAMIGMTQVREIALISCVNAASDRAGLTGIQAIRMQRHALAVGVCCQELALHVQRPVSLDKALIGGLLHNIGQFWFSTYARDFYEACLTEASASGRNIESVEVDQFGVDHCTVGGWLLDYWALPQDIVAAVREHRSAVQGTGSHLTALVHVADVISNALSLAGVCGDRVTTISPHACRMLGIQWDDGVRALFGRIEARVRHAESFLGLPP